MFNRSSLKGVPGKPYQLFTSQFLFTRANEVNRQQIMADSVGNHKSAQWNAAAAGGNYFHPRCSLRAVPRQNSIKHMTDVFCRVQSFIPTQVHFTAASMQAMTRGDWHTCRLLVQIEICAIARKKCELATPRPHGWSENCAAAVTLSRIK